MITDVGWLWLRPCTAETEKKPISAAEVVVPGQSSAGAPKYAHPGSFKPVATGGSDSGVPDAEFTDVSTSSSGGGGVPEEPKARKARKRRRKTKGKRR
jgi:hypothetical protein